MKRNWKKLLRLWRRQPFHRIFVETLALHIHLTTNEGVGHWRPRGKHWR